MQGNRKQNNKYVIIRDDFREQGLTLEQAYILGRVSRFNNLGLPCYESYKTLSKIMGKSESTVRRAIDGLVKEGNLYKKTLPRKRLLSIKPFNYEGQNEPNKNNKGVHREQLIDVHREHHKSNKNASESSMLFTENNIGVHNEQHDLFTENTYKIEDKIEDKEEKTQKPDITKLTEERALNNKLPDNENIVLTEEQKRIKEEIERIGRGY